MDNFSTTFIVTLMKLSLELQTSNRFFFPYLTAFGIKKCIFVIWKAFTVSLSGFDIPFHFSAGSEKQK